MDHRYVKCTSASASVSASALVGELKYCNVLGVFNKTIIPHVLVGFESLREL